MRKIEITIQKSTFNLQDLATMDHGDVLKEMWWLSRETSSKRLTDFQRYTKRCIVLAARGDPCTQTDIEDYAAVKFVAALWTDRVEIDTGLAQLFSAYVKHGFICPNKIMRCDAKVSSHYQWLGGQAPLVPAVLLGNLHTAEQLILHGANTNIDVEGLEFFNFVRRNVSMTLLHLAS